MKQIGQGRTADIFEYEKDKIVKLYKDDFPEEAIHQEFQISQLAYSVGIKTPRAHQIVRVDDRLGIIFERIHGVSLLNTMTTKFWTINRCSKTLAQLHHSIHANIAVRGFRNQKSTLSENIKATPLLSQEEKIRVIQYLDELPDGNKICHGDFHPDNVLDNNGRWIIDWMTGMAGDPTGDVARTLILLRCGTMPDETPRIVKAMVNFLRNKISKIYIRQYLQHSGLEYSIIERWILPVAAARLVESIPREEQNTLIQIIREKLNETS